MTVLAGIRCNDGFIVAADTAVTFGDTVFRDRKVDYYKGGDFTVVVACAGDLAYAKMASQAIQEAIAHLNKPTTADIKLSVSNVLTHVYEKYIFPLWSARGSDYDGVFELIVAIQAQNEFEVLATSRTAVYSIERYHFAGSGAPIAQHLAERYLRSRSEQHMTIPTAIAVHVVQQFFDIVKISAPGVGRDTEIIAWRNSPDADRFFTPPPQMQDWLWALEENLKYAIWEALDRPGAPDGMLQGLIEKIGSLLRAVHKHGQEDRNIGARAVRFTGRDKGEWRMQSLAD